MLPGQNLLFLPLLAWSGLFKGRRSCATRHKLELNYLPGDTDALDWLAAYAVDRDR